MTIPSSSASRRARAKLWLPPGVLERVVADEADPLERLPATRLEGRRPDRQLGDLGRQLDDLADARAEDVLEAAAVVAAGECVEPPAERRRPAARPRTARTSADHEEHGEDDEERTARLLDGHGHVSGCLRLRGSPSLAGGPSRSPSTRRGAILSRGGPTRLAPRSSVRSRRIHQAHGQTSPRHIPTRPAPADPEDVGPAGLELAGDPGDRAGRRRRRGVRPPATPRRSPPHRRRASAAPDPRGVGHVQRVGRPGVRLRPLRPAPDRPGRSRPVRDDVRPVHPHRRARASSSSEPRAGLVGRIAPVVD